MRRLFCIVVLLTVIFIPLSAQDGGDDTNGDGRPDRWIRSTGGVIEEIGIDRDYDGTVDYLTKYDQEFRKIEEQLDFNYDGQMDDFYYYKAEKMYRREIDTNFDGKVDIWVYLDGIYIQKYEKDTDFDGKIDLTEDYTKE
ncbi:MAG: hypothetical protein JEZ04_20065 [Spirochaetales bacterium]|nr:hypothetical protein [Spirochaetales bacterium]